MLIYDDFLFVSEIWLSGIQAIWEELSWFTMVFLNQDGESLNLANHKI